MPTVLLNQTLDQKKNRGFGLGLGSGPKPKPKDPNIY